MLFSTSAEINLLKIWNLHLITTKPFLYVFNLHEEVQAFTECHAELSAMSAAAECGLLDA